MSETIDYAEMLEIPVNTLNVTKKRSKRKVIKEELERKIPLNMSKNAPILSLNGCQLKVI